MVAQRLPERRVSHGFLEFARPTIGTVLAALRDEGAGAIDAVPGMLFAAGHAKNDIPSVLNDFAAANPGLEVRYGRDLAVDPLLLRAAAERIEASQQPGDAPPADSLLVVVGRGTSDPDANSNIAKVTRMLWEGLGYGWAETCYSGVTTPLVGPALGRIAGFGFRRIVVFPYFLFTGVVGASHLRRGGRRRPRPSRHRLPQGRLSQRPPAGGGRLPRAHRRDFPRATTV